MTDYLELLLDGWQEENESEPFVWKKTGSGYRDLGGEDGVQPVAGREKAGAEVTGEQGREENPREKRAHETGRVADPEAQLAALERAVARGNAQRTAREWNRERAEKAQATGARDIRGINVAAPGVQRGLAGLLDAAFERDARRYDGPLELF